MLRKAMRFATVCTLAFAICGKANRYERAAVSKGTTEDLEHRFRQETNFEDHLSTTSSCSRVRSRLAVVLTLSSAVTSGDAFAPRIGQSSGVRPIQKVSNTTFAPILTNNPLHGSRDMLRPVNAARANFAPNLATPQVISDDMELDPTGVSHYIKSIPTPTDVEAFRSLNKQKHCRLSVEALKGIGPALWARMKTPQPQFNVLEEYTRQAALWGISPTSTKLTAEEQAALWGYTHTDSHIINQIAMGANKVEFEDSYYDQELELTAETTCTLTREDMLPWLMILNAGLNKMPSAAAGRLYRGVGLHALDRPGSIAPIRGFSSFSEDFNVAECLVEEERKDGIQPTIFVMDTHSSGVQLEQIGDNKEVVFSFTKFVIEEDEKVQRKVEAEVVALWREKAEAPAWWTEAWPTETIAQFQNSSYSQDGEAQASGVFYHEAEPSQQRMGVPPFKVLVIKEVFLPSRAAEPWALDIVQALVVEEPAVKEVPPSAPRSSPVDLNLALKELLGEEPALEEPDVEEVPPTAE